MQNPTEVKLAAATIRSKFGAIPDNTVGMVIGTGLSHIAAIVKDAARLEYGRVPGFPLPGVMSHEAALLFGTVGFRPVIACLGRVHLYEGRNPTEVSMQVRALAELGVRELVLTNAAGSLNPDYKAGGLMLISDQINFTGQSPLTGQNYDSWGPRFPDCGRLYPESSRQTARDAAVELGIDIQEGVYLGLTGPSLETPAEVRAFRTLGADALGMSTVLEALAAGHRGMKILGLSCLTNSLTDACTAPPTIEAIIAQANQSSGNMARLLEAVIPKL